MKEEVFDLVHDAMSGVGNVKLLHGVYMWKIVMS